MTRREAVAALAVAAALIAGGLTWLAGPWGLICSGVALAVLVLLGVNIRDEERGAREAVADPAAWPPVGRGVPL
jgi:hypothetical protein